MEAGKMKALKKFMDEMGLEYETKEGESEMGTYEIISFVGVSHTGKPENEEQKFGRYKRLTEKLKRTKTTMKVILGEMKQIDRQIPHRTNPFGNYEKQGGA